MSERTDADKLANRLLDEPNADPDDDLRMLSRQLLRRNEVIDKLKKALVDQQDPTRDMIEANRDSIFRKHEEAVRLIGKVLVGGGNKHDAEKLVYIGKVLHALNTFHPMHGESWIGWP
jgi:hypothetical protein